MIACTTAAADTWMGRPGSPPPPATPAPWGAPHCCGRSPSAVLWHCAPTHLGSPPCTRAQYPDRTVVLRAQAPPPFQRCTLSGIVHRIGQLCAPPCSLTHSHHTNHRLLATQLPSHTTTHHPALQHADGSLIPPCIIRSQLHTLQCARYISFPPSSPALPSRPIGGTPEPACTIPLQHAERLQLSQALLTQGCCSGAGSCLQPSVSSTPSW